MHKRIGYFIHDIFAAVYSGVVSIVACAAEFIEAILWGDCDV